MAENLLQIAAGSFMKAKQPEKTTQVQEILATVREEKALSCIFKSSYASTYNSFNHLCLFQLHHQPVKYQWV